MKNKMNKYPITMSLIIINILVYLYTTIKYGFEMNAFEGYLVGGYTPLALTYDHEYWRLITSNFIHFGFFHILCNMISLYNISPFVEIIFGKKRFIVLVIGCILATNGLPYLLTSQQISNRITISGGASGIVLGLLGAIFMMSRLYKGIFKRVFESILPSLVLIVIVSLSSAQISMAGHLGGFIGGMVTTYLINKFWGFKQ